MPANRIKPSGGLSIIKPRNGKQFTKAELEKQVGRPAVLVLDKLKGRGMAMVVNGKGVLNKMEVNLTAGELANTAIVGTAVYLEKSLLNLEDWEG